MQESPIPGQKWHIPDYVKGSSPFVTLMGSFMAPPSMPRTSSMSVHVYRLEEGVEDRQTPHAEDEVYFVLSGSRMLVMDDDQTLRQEVPVTQGDLVFVPANAKHTFEGDSEIVLLVFFAPDFTGPQTQ
jgi:mannose-6-phosphate isomerase-like protein (cupin superfamily)